MLTLILSSVRNITEQQARIDDNWSLRRERSFRQPLASFKGSSPYNSGTTAASGQGALVASQADKDESSGSQNRTKGAKLGASMQNTAVTYV